MHLCNLIKRAALSTVLAAVLTACGTGGVNTEPENFEGGQPETAKEQPKKVADVGDTVPIKDDSAGVSLSVTLTKVVDPAEAGEFETVPNGIRLVSAQFRVKNNSDSEYQDSPSNGARLIDTSDQAHDASLITVADCKEFAGGEIRLTSGDRQIGCVTFEVEKNTVVERIRFGASSGFGSAAEWKIR